MEDEGEGEGGDEEGAKDRKLNWGNDEIFEIDSGRDKGVNLDVGDDPGNYVESDDVGHPAEYTHGDEVDGQKKEIDNGADE